MGYVYIIKIDIIIVKDIYGYNPKGFDGNKVSYTLASEIHLILYIYIYIYIFLPSIDFMSLIKSNHGNQLRKTIYKL